METTTALDSACNMLWYIESEMRALITASSSRAERLLLLEMIRDIEGGKGNQRLENLHKALGTQVLVCRLDRNTEGLLS